MGERGGLGGGDEGGLVIGSADCTATGSLGAGSAGAEPGRKPDEVSVADWAGELANGASLATRSRRRDFAASSRARKSSWSLARRASSKLRMLGGMTDREAGAAAATSWGSM